MSSSGSGGSGDGSSGSPAYFFENYYFWSGLCMICFGVIRTESVWNHLCKVLYPSIQGLFRNSLHEVQTALGTSGIGLFPLISLNFVVRSGLIFCAWV